MLKPRCLSTTNLLAVSSGAAFEKAYAAHKQSGWGITGKEGMASSQSETQHCNQRYALRCERVTGGVPTGFVREPLGRLRVPTGCLPEDGGPARFGC